MGFLEIVRVGVSDGLGREEEEEAREREEKERGFGKGRKGERTDVISTHVSCFCADGVVC